MPYTTMSVWARARASALHKQAAAIPMVPSADWRGGRSRVAHQRTLQDEAARFDRIAVALSAKGR